MNQRQANTHRMYSDTLELFDSRTQVWEGDEAAEEAVAEFRTAVDEASEIDRERNALATPGLTDDKQATRDAMEAVALRVAKATRAYARKAKDGALFGAVDLTADRFNKATESDATGMAARVADAAEGHLAALAKYRVTGKDVAAVRGAVAAFRTAAPLVGAAGGKREARTRSLRAAFVAADEALDALDDVVDGVLDDAEFRAEYWRVRRTDDR